MIENEYSRQEDAYKQQIADLEEEKEQLQVGIVKWVTPGWKHTLFRTFWDKKKNNIFENR